MFPLGSKLGPVGRKLEHNKEDQLQFFLSETGTGRALIFGMQYVLVDLYQVYSYDASGVKSGPASGSQVGT